MTNGKRKKSQKRILVAEDEKLMAKALEAQFSRAGFITRVAGDGADALDCLDKEKFDLILLDILMPKMNGLELLQELRSKGDHTPVVVLSNSSREETVQRAESLGVERYLIKSNVKIGDIINIVRDVLHVGGGENI